MIVPGRDFRESDDTKMPLQLDPETVSQEIFLASRKYLRTIPRLPCHKITNIVCIQTTILLGLATTMKFSTVTIIFAISAAGSRSITMVSARADSKAGKSKAPKAKASKVNYHAGGRASYSFSSTLIPTLLPTISPVSNLLSYHLTSVYKQTITLPLYLTTHLHTLQTFNRR